MRILFVPTIAGKQWNGASIYSGALGGSESAVAYMARALVRLGETEVTVLSHDQPGVFDGVAYRHINDLNVVLQEQWDVLVVSRYVEALTFPWKATYRVLWLHDMPYPVATAIQVNKVYCISKFQKACWGFRDGDVNITSDGVDTSVFQALPFESRDWNKLLWISNPDRGLPLAAKIFQEIRKRWPDMQLHVYGRASVYGWDASVEAPFMPRPEHSENVFLHEPLSRIMLARELGTAFALFYPTYWPEVFCMAALEAQACGTPVISSGVGALPETVVGGILTNDFLNAVSQLRNRNRWEKLHTEGVEHAKKYDWSLVANDWLEKFQSALGK